MLIIVLSKPFGSMTRKENGDKTVQGRGGAWAEGPAWCFEKGAACALVPESRPAGPDGISQELGKAGEGEGKGCVLSRPELEQQIHLENAAFWNHLGELLGM